MNNVIRVRREKRLFPIRATSKPNGDCGWFLGPQLRAFVHARLACAWGGKQTLSDREGEREDRRVYKTSMKKNESL